MAGLTIKITADTAKAASDLRNLAGSSEELAAKLEKANNKLAKVDVSNFIDRQSLTTAALQATRGEMGALDASIASYQRKIERLIKDTLAPEGDAVKALQGELGNLQRRRAELQARADAQAESERKIAEAAKAVKEAMEQEAAIAVKSLDAKTELEKINIQLESRQDKLKEQIRSLVESGIKPEAVEIKNLEAEYRKLTKEIEENADAQAESERKIAEAAKAVEEAMKREAAVAVKSLDAKTELEKINIRLESRQDKLKEQIRSLVESGIKPEAVEIKNLEAEYRKLTKEIEENTKKQAAQETAVKGALAALAALGAAAAAAGAFAIKSAANVEDMAAAFEPMLGSAEEARKLVKQLNKEAVSTPFEIESINAAVRRLMPAFQGDTEKAIKTFRMIGDTAGGNAQKLDTLTNAYTKVLLKGKTSMEELDMIANAGVPIYTELAEVMGVSVNTLADMSSKGKISADDLTAAFEKMTGAGGIFYQGMKKSAFTFNAQMLGLREDITLAAAAIGEKLLPAAKELVGNAVDAADSFLAWAEEGENLNDLLRNLGTVIAGTSAALGTFVAVSKGHAAVTAMAGAVKLLTGALTGPAGMAAIAIGGIVTALAAYRNHQLKAIREEEIFAEELTATENKANELLSAYDKLNPGKALDKKTTEELIQLYPELSAELSRNGLAIEEARKKIEDYNFETAKEKFAPQIAHLQSLIEEWEIYQRDLAAVRQEQAELNRFIKENPGVNTEVNQRETEYSISFNIEKVKEAEQNYRDSFERINELAKSYGLKIGENLSITKLPVPSFDNPALIPDIESPQNPNNQEGEKESEITSILKEARKAVEEYGKSETELTVIKLKGLGATEAEIAQYKGEAAELKKLKDAEEEREKIKKNESEKTEILKEARKAVEEYGKSETELTVIKLKGLGATEAEIQRYKDEAAELQKLKDADGVDSILKEARKAVDEYGVSETALTEAKLKGLGATEAEILLYRGLAAESQKLKKAEEERVEAEKATEEAQGKEQDYLRQLEELHIKNDDIKNDEAQLLELQRSRMEAEINASKASDDAKKGSLAALNAYYNEMIKLSNEEFGKEDAEKTEKEKLEKFKKDLAEELDAQKGNIKQRIEVLRNGLNEIEKAEGISAENIKLIQQGITNQIAEETAKQKQARIDTSLQALSAVQDLTNVFGGIAKQQADERAAQETARLEAEKAANSRALIDKYNEEISVEGMTEEEKQRIKERFLDLYEQNEKDYTDAVKEEEEKRKNAAKEAAIADKVLSAATAGINSYVAFTGALANQAKINPILAGIQAGAILAAGLAQQAKIVATPITAETGGRFVVPYAPGVDGVGLRVNPDEKVNITPRGESSSDIIHVVVMMNEQPIYDVVNKGIRSGDIIPLGSNL